MAYPDRPGAEKKGHNGRLLHPLAEFLAYFPEPQTKAVCNDSRHISKSYSESQFFFFLKVHVESKSSGSFRLLRKEQLVVFFVCLLFYLISRQHTERIATVNKYKKIRRQTQVTFAAKQHVRGQVFRSPFSPFISQQK